MITGDPVGSIVTGPVGWTGLWTSTMISETEGLGEASHYLMKSKPGWSKAMW